MYNFDASSMIHAWDNYPIDNPHFNSLWDWFCEQIKQKEFVFSEIAFDEISHKIPECGEWLKNNKVEIYPLSADAILQAQSIKILLEIEEEVYTKGVGENDLFIISIAKIYNSILITEESRQLSLPAKKSNYKIPAVCELDEVNVNCKSFIDLLKEI
ncbi:MAG: DUF4411 family protein [Sulfurimonas sp.]|nr:DUF4411 family protein [Sulfurimonas sp.]